MHDGAGSRDLGGIRFAVQLLTSYCDEQMRMRRCDDAKDVLPTLGSEQH